MESGCPLQQGKKSGLQSNFSGIEYADVLALDDNTDYVLYSVDGMWVNGDVKLWTGWNGGVKDNTRYGSLWTANWGHYKALDSTTKITAGSTVPLGDAKGDMTFPEPTYFKSVDFFLNKSNPTKGSLLFTELATGGAEIAALSRENYTYGMYRPRLKNTANIQTQSLNSVTITTYKSDDDMNTTPINVVVNNTYSDKKVSDWDSLFAYNQVSDNEKWVYDTYKYENGNYKYVMVVNINGEDIKVESNPFTIFVGEANATLKTYQLVKREHPSPAVDDMGIGYTEYQYVTYSTRPNDKTYLVKVRLNNSIGDNVSVADALNYDKVTDVEDVIELTNEELIKKVDYSDGTHFRFSPKLLLIGKITGKNVEKVNFTNGDASVEELGIDSGIIAVMLKSSIKDDNYKDTFYAVVEPVFYHDLEGGKSSGFNYSYKWSPEFNYNFEDADGSMKTKTGETDEVVIDDYLVFPEPKLIIEESRIEMFYGDSPTGTDDVISNHFSINVADNMDGYESDLSAVTLGDPDNNRDGARFQQIRTAIVVERPNITRRYIALAADFIKEEAKKDGLNVSYNFGDDDNSAPLMEALFDFYLGKEQVKMSNSMTYTDNGGNPEWFVYYTPTRKPGDIYYNVYANNGITNDWDLATNLGVVEGKAFQTKTMSHKLRKAFEELHIYERWKDGDIAGIRIQQNPPVNALKSEATQSSMARVSDSEKGTAVESDGTTRDTNIRVIGSGLTYDSNGDLIETVNVNIKFKSATKNSLARVDKDGNPYDLNDATYNGKDMHYDPTSSDDYFYVRIVDENGEDLVDANTISAKDLADGYTLKIEKNHGHYWDGQLDVVKANSLIKTMTLKMSHLYPFIYGTQVNDITVGASVATEAAEAPARVMRKAEGDPVVSTFENDIVDSNSDTESDVIKSNPVDYTFVDGEVVTSVEGLEALLSDSVITGVGYIEVHGEGVEIYGADGIKIATGEGRYEVGAGVYVVRLNGRAEKVIVR